MMVFIADETVRSDYMHDLAFCRLLLILAELSLAKSPLTELYTHRTIPMFFIVIASGMFRGRDVAQG